MSKYLCQCGVKHTLDRKTGVSNRKDKHVLVEDHGNGYMLTGTIDMEQALRVLEDYVDDIDDYAFRARVFYHEDSTDKRVHSIWLAVGPGLYWEGATYPDGTPLPRAD